MAHKLTQKKLLTYLNTVDEGREFVAGDPFSCPIAGFLEDTYGVKSPAVNTQSADYFSKDGKHYFFNLPKWGTKFVRALDREYQNARYVKPADVITVLKGVMRGRYV